MKKLALTCAVLLALVAFAAPDAQAQVCMKFVSFCDGVQINSVSNQNINATWYHYDCANSAPFTSGKKGETPVQNGCPGGSPIPGGQVTCQNCFGFGDWYFVIDAPFDGTFDMNQGLPGGGSCWIDQLAYSLQLGACTGLRQAGERGQEQDRSSIQ